MTVASIRIFEYDGICHFIRIHRVISFALIVKSDCDCQSAES